MQKWETNVCQWNESFIIRVHNFVEQLLNRYCMYLPDFLADKVFQLFCFFKSSIFTVRDQDASLHYQEMSTSEDHHGTHLAGDRMHGLDVMAGVLPVLFLPTQHVHLFTPPSSAGAFHSHFLQNIKNRYKWGRSGSGS